jgi:hypothetical protein
VPRLKNQSARRAYACFVEIPLVLLIGCYPHAQEPTHSGTKATGRSMPESVPHTHASLNGCSCLIYRDGAIFIRHTARSLGTPWYRYGPDVPHLKEFTEGCHLHRREERAALWVRMSASGILHPQASPQSGARVGGTLALELGALGVSGSSSSSFVFHCANATM